MNSEKSQIVLHKWLRDSVTEEIITEVSKNKYIDPDDFIKAYSFLSGYSIRDKEAEDEKRELIKALIIVYSVNKHESSYIASLYKLIKKHTGKPIDEVTK